MLRVPVELRKDALINAVIATVLREFSPEVKYIRYAIDQDWNGDWTIFFRVVLSAEIDLPNLELWPSVNFRYEGEPVDSDPNWAPLRA
jgi:hypothetical protein